MEIKNNQLVHYILVYKWMISVFLATMKYISGYVSERCLAFFQFSNNFQWFINWFQLIQIIFQMVQSLFVWLENPFLDLIPWLWRTPSLIWVGLRESWSWFLVLFAVSIPNHGRFYDSIRSEITDFLAFCFSMPYFKLQAYFKGNKNPDYVPCFNITMNPPLFIYLF